MKYNAYIGSYAKAGEKGICKIIFEPDKFDIIASNNSIENPSYLASKENYLYAVSEVSADIGSDFVTLDKRTLDIIDTVHTAEGGACHIFISSALDTAYISNYDTGSTTVFPLNSGLPLGQYSVFKNKGKGSENPRQATPHAHFLCETVSPFRLMSIDLSADKAYIYNASPAPNSRLTFISHCKLPKGAGPRHGVFCGNTAYILTELSNEIYICDYHSGSGSLWAKSRISTLPRDCSVSSTAAAVKLSPNGKLLFASNRDHDSIASFKITTSGLSLISITPCGGKHPRDIAITPDGKFLLSANTYSDNITVFEINDGKLTQISDFSGFIAPSCIIFD